MWCSAARWADRRSAPPCRSLRRCARAIPSRSTSAGSSSRPSSQIFAEPGRRAVPRLLVRRLVVAAALVAAEAVAGALVDIDVAIRTLLLDQVDVGHRDRLVL